MSDLQIREAIPDDAPAIEHLYRSLVPNDENIQVTAERTAEIASDPNNFLFVVGEADSVYGTAFLTLCLDPMYGSMPYAVLENIIVDPAKRHRGCGKALLQTIEQFCWNRRCTKIMFLSAISREEAHQFFAAHGFHSDKKKAFVKYRRAVYDASAV